MPDTCVPIDENSNCPATCPLVCDHDDLMCPGDIDENGCETGAFCQHNDHTSICQSACPTKCPEGEWECPPETDNRGCHMPGPCSTNGKLNIFLRALLHTRKNTKKIFAKHFSTYT